MAKRRKKANGALKLGIDRLEVAQDELFNAVDHLIDVEGIDIGANISVLQFLQRGIEEQRVELEELA